MSIHPFPMPPASTGATASRRRTAQQQQQPARFWLNRQQQQQGYSEYQHGQAAPAGRTFQHIDPSQRNQSTS